MATFTCDLPLSSQHSSSDLSEPPDFTEEEIALFTATMAPQTRSQRVSKGDVSANTQAKATGGSVLSNGRSIDIESTNNKDEIAAEIEVAPRTSRRRVPSKRAQVTFSPPASSATPASKRPKTNAKKWTPEYVTQSKQSPLVSKDLRALLLHPGAWDVLGEEDKKEILALFPDTRHILNANTPDARPNVMSLQNDNNFRHDTEEYVSNLKAGMHDPVWLRDAWAAHEARAAGQFDEYYIRKLEIDWKTTIPEELKPEHLRSISPTESKQDAMSEAHTEGPPSADRVTKNEEAADDAQAEGTHVSATPNRSIKPDKVSGSEVLEKSTEANGDDDVQDVVMTSSADESSESVTKGLQNVSVGSAHQTDHNPDKAHATRGVD